MGILDYVCLAVFGLMHYEGWRIFAIQRSALSMMNTFSTSDAEFMALASCCCAIMWARKLALELGFVQQPTDVYVIQGQPWLHQSC